MLVIVFQDRSNTLDTNMLPYGQSTDDRTRFRHLCDACMHYLTCCWRIACCVGSVCGVDVHDYEVRKGEGRIGKEAK